MPASIPSHLRSHADEYQSDPRGAGLSWFREAGFGMFVHYNNTSLLPGSKFDPIPDGVTCEQLSQRFKAENFDAEAIADLAISAGAKYVCFTPYHGGGPYLWNSAIGRPKSTELPAGRDLVAELSTACAKRGLGYFHYIHFTLSQSHDAVWAQNQILLRELGTRYGQIAGWWIDSAPHYHANRGKYPRINETYALMRELQPHALISFCEGVTGDEDYVTYEHGKGLLENAVETTAILHRDKPLEVCTTLQLDKPGGSGWRMWFNVDHAYHLTPDEAWRKLMDARGDGANLLLNTGLLPDGSVHPVDRAAFVEIGRRLRGEA